MSEFTKGPWAVDPKRSLRIMSGTDRDTTIASVGGDVTIRDDWDANAHLIASAPEMYDALKAAQRFIARVEDLHQTISAPMELEDDIADALAKAEGKL